MAVKGMASLMLLTGCATTRLIQTPASFLVAGPRPKVMFLGTFHFADAGLDSYKPKHDINIMERARQREVEALVDRLAQFKPTKVALEIKSANIDRMNQLYRDYLDGKFALKSNEIYQIGFRLARKMGHKRIYGIDVNARPYYTDAQWKEETEKLRGDEDSPWDARFKQLYAHDDELKTKMPLADYLRYINSSERVRAGHGVYLTGTFHLGKGDNYFGPDNLTGWWYNRNLRIFENVFRIIESPQERVLVLIGAGHLPIILHAAQSSPEIEVVSPF